MPGALNKMELAVRQTPGHVVRQTGREGPVFRSMPKRNRDANFFEGKPPGGRINLGIGHDPFRGRAPGVAGAVEADVELAGFAQYVRVAGLEKFQEQRPDPERHSHRDERPSQMKK